MIEITPEKIWAEYEKCKGYNNSIQLDETVEQNENFYIGKQWEGLAAPDLDKPVLNFLKRVVNYFISMIVTDNIAVAVSSQNQGRANEIVAAAIQKEVDKVIEQNDLISKNRDLLRDAAVDGDAFLYCYFNPETERVCAEILQNTNVLFGNPYLSSVQQQPFIIVEKPMLLQTVKEKAEQLGIDPELIYPDDRYSANKNAYGADRTTVLIKFWKDRKTKTIHYCETLRDIVLKKDIDTGYRIFPIAYMCWDKIKNSYHGQAAVTGLIPNQIAVNKLWAMALRHQQLMAFPKVFYDRLKIREWNNRVGEAIGVTGSPNEAIATDFRASDMSDQLIQLVDKTISYTRDFMGASDAALGNVKPDNTSAILAVQKASSAPLELQKLSFYQFVEDYVRVIVEIICTDQGYIEAQLGEEEDEPTVRVRISGTDADSLNLKVDVGASAYWSELAQLETLDNLFLKGIITDAVTYIEGIPDAYLKNKNRIIQKIKQHSEAMALMKGEEKNAMPKMQNRT